MNEDKYIIAGYNPDQPAQLLRVFMSQYQVSKRHDKQQCVILF